MESDALRTRMVAEANQVHAERIVVTRAGAFPTRSVTRVLRQLLVQVDLRLRHRPQHSRWLHVPWDHGRIRRLGRLEHRETLTHEIEPALALERELPLPLVEDGGAHLRLALSRRQIGRKRTRLAARAVARARADHVHVTDRRVGLTLL